MKKWEVCVKETPMRDVYAMVEWARENTGSLNFAMKLKGWSDFKYDETEINRAIMIRKFEDGNLDDKYLEQKTTVQFKFRKPDIAALFRLTWG